MVLRTQTLKRNGVQRTQTIEEWEQIAGELAASDSPWQRELAFDLHSQIAFAGLGSEAEFTIGLTHRAIGSVVTTKVGRQRR